MSVWDFYNSKQFRLSVILLMAGTIGLLLMAFIARVPLAVSILGAVFVGAFGASAAVLQAIGRAIVRPAPGVEVVQRSPHEFIRHSGGHINIAHITHTELLGGGIDVFFVNRVRAEFLSGDEANEFITHMDQLATPLLAMGAPTATNGDEHRHPSPEDAIPDPF